VAIEIRNETINHIESATFEDIIRREKNLSEKVA
jgi:hypothetical protein